MATPTVSTTWNVDDGALSAAITERPMGADGLLRAVELSLDQLPTIVKRDSGQEGSSCEVMVEFGSSLPLQCRVLQLQVTSSARHMELHAKGVRRSMLGEDELSEVYFGTYRGTKSAGDAGGVQFFDVAQEFKQADRDHDVLKCVHTLRIKFVSLAGDKNALQLTKFKCMYIATATPSQPVAAPSMKPVPIATPPASAQISSPDLMSIVAGLSSGGVNVGGMNPQVIMAMVQQMMEREVEAKINRVLDAKLSALSQRLAFSEQMLLQVQQKTSDKSELLEKKLATLQQQVADMRTQAAIEKEPEHGTE